MLEHLLRAAKNSDLREIMDTSMGACTLFMQVKWFLMFGSRKRVTIHISSLGQASERCFAANPSLTSVSILRGSMNRSLFSAKQIIQILTQCDIGKMTSYCFYLFRSWGYLGGAGQVHADVGHAVCSGGARARCDSHASSQRIHSSAQVETEPAQLQAAFQKPATSWGVRTHCNMLHNAAWVCIPRPRNRLFSCMMFACWFFHAHPFRIELRLAA